MGGYDDCKPAAPAASPASDGLIDVRLTAIRYAARDTNLYEFARPDGKPLPRLRAGRAYRPASAQRPRPAIFADRRQARTRELHRRHQARPGEPRRLALHPRRAARRQDAADQRAAQQFSAQGGRRHVILFAGGIGITPIWCMVQRLEALGRSWKLYYSCRSRADMAFLETLEAMAPGDASISTTRAPESFSISRALSRRRRRTRTSIAAVRRRCSRLRGGDRGLAARAGPHRIFHAQGRARQEGRLHGRAGALGPGVLHPRGQDDPRGAARCRRRRRLFLRARHLRRLRAAGDLRHPGAPRLHPHRGGAGREQARHDLLRRLQERAAGAGLCRRPHSRANEIGPASPPGRSRVRSTVLNC